MSVSDTDTNTHFFRDFRDTELPSSTPLVRSKYLFGLSRVNIWDSSKRLKRSKDVRLKTEGSKEMLCLTILGSL